MRYYREGDAHIYSFLTNGERVLPTVFVNSCIVKIERKTAFYDFLRI